MKRPCEIYKKKKKKIGILTIEVFLLGSTDFMRCGLADGFADGGSSHAVLGRSDAICDGLS